MKRLFVLLCASALAWACGGNKQAELFVPNNAVELAGNGSDVFSIGADVRLYMSPDIENPKFWNVMAVAPVRKDTQATITSLGMELTLLDADGARVRDSFPLRAEDLENLLSEFNGAPAVERVVLFSIPEIDGGKKRFSTNQAKAMIGATKGISIGINAEQRVVEETKPEDVPNTLPWLLKKTGVNTLLNQYKAAVKKKDIRKAGDVERKIYKIEKEVKGNKKYPENLRKRFLDYVENKIEDIDDKY